MSVSSKKEEPGDVPASSSNEWITKECAAYQMPDGTLIPVTFTYPKFITVIIGADNAAE